MFSLVCAGCQQPIQPKKGQTKAPRIRAMDQVRRKKWTKVTNLMQIISGLPHQLLQVLWLWPRAEPRHQGERALAWNKKQNLLLQVSFKRFLWDCQMGIALVGNKNVTDMINNLLLSRCYRRRQSESESESDWLWSCQFLKSSEKYLQLISSSSPVLMSPGYHLMMNDVSIFSQKLWCYF